MRSLPPILLALWVSSGLLAGAVVADLPPIPPNPYDMLLLNDGERLIGTIERETEDGTVFFRTSGSKSALPYRKNQYNLRDKSLNPVETVRARIRMLLATDFKEDPAPEIERTIKYAIDQKLLDLAKELSYKAAAASPQETQVVERMIEIHKDDPAGKLERLAVIIAALEANSMFENGYVLLVEGLRGGDAASVHALIARFVKDHPRSHLAPVAAAEPSQAAGVLVNRWLARRPTSPEANRLATELASQSADLGQIRENFRKLWLFGKEPVAGAGYARTSLMLGDLGEAEKTAAELIKANIQTPLAKGILGTVRLVQGRLEEAGPALEAACAELTGIDPEVAMVFRYNRGLVALRKGDRPAALAAWQGLDLPVAEFGRAVAERRMPAEGLKIAGQDDELDEVRACLLMEQGRLDDARKLLKPQSGTRHMFLSRVLEMLQARGQAKAVKVLGVESSPESLRWQLYGHLIAGRLPDAAAVIDELHKLVPDDPYAAAARVYLAEATNRRDQARELVKTLPAATGRLQEYMAILVAEYDAERDEMRKISFDWPDGSTLLEGWMSENRGTGLMVRIQQGDLVLDGTQTGNGLTRAWRWWPARRLSTVAVVLDLEKLGEGGEAGLEIRDANGLIGLTYARTATGPAWRAMHEGRWGDWQPLVGDQAAKEGRFELSYDPRLGRFFVRTNAGRTPLGADFKVDSDRMMVGISVRGKEGAAVLVRAKEMTVQLKAAEK